MHELRNENDACFMECAKATEETLKLKVGRLLVLLQECLCLVPVVYLAEE